MTRSLQPDERLATAANGPNDAINLQLYRRLVALIATGHWTSGSRLPSSRALAVDSGVSRTTASLALDRLVADGWAVARPRSGLYVAAAGPRSPFGAPERHGRPGTYPVPFELSQGAVDCFPLARWSRIQSRVWASNVSDALYEPQIAGDLGLRSSIVRHLMVSRGIECSVEDVLIVASTRAALSLTASMLAIDSTTAAVEDPGYWRGAETLAAGGLPNMAVPVDRDGLDVGALREGVNGTMLAYATPAAQFPTGVILSAERRDALVDWCIGGGHWLFEDDYDWDARFDGLRPPPPLKAGAAAERTFYCQSFSRTMFSSFRMAVLIVPSALRERAIAAQDRIVGFSNLPNQLVLREFINTGGYAGHLRSLRAAHQDRRSALLDLVGPFLGHDFEPEVNPAGFAWSCAAAPPTPCASPPACGRRGFCARRSAIYRRAVLPTMAWSLALPPFRSRPSSPAATSSPAPSETDSRGRKKSPPKRAF